MAFRRLLSQKNPEPITALAAVGDAIEDTKRTAEIVRRVRFLFKGHADKKIPIRIGELVNEVVKLVVPIQNLNPDVSMVEPAEDWYRCDAAEPLRPPKIRSIFIQ